MQHRKMKGSVSTNRPRGSGNPEYAQIDVNDELSGTRVLTVRIPLKDFAEALFGLAHVECEFDLNPDLVGKKCEHKQEMVPIEDGLRYADRSSPLAAKALAPFEVDGWKGRVDDLFNPHRRGGNSARVTFVRYVEVE